MMPRLLVLLLLVLAAPQARPPGLWETVHSSHSDFPGYLFLDARNGWKFNTQGLQRTTDGGETWAATASGLADTVWGLQFIHPDTGWAIDGQRRLHGTRDGGRTWNPLSPLPKGRTSRQFLDGRNGFMSVEDTLFASSDGGGSFSRRSLLPDGAFYWKFLDGGRGYAWASRSGVYRTLDGGRTWAPYAFTSGGFVTALNFQPPGLGWYLGYDAVQATYTFNRTQDGGETWTGRPLVLPIGRWGDPVQPFGNITCFGDTLYFVTMDNRSFHRSYDGGLTWAWRSIGDTEWGQSIQFTDSRTGWIMGEDFLYRTTDAGNTWRTLRRQLNGDLRFIAAAFPDYRTGWAVDQDGAVLKTSDGGLDWEWQIEDSLRMTGLHFADTRVGCVLGHKLGDEYYSDKDERGVLRCTRDGGSTWNRRMLAVAERMDAVHFPSARVGYITGRRTRTDSLVIQKTEDAGLTWTMTRLPLIGKWTHVQFQDETRGWAGGSVDKVKGSVLYRTDDGGATWSLLHHDSASGLLAAQWFDASRGIRLTTDRMLRTADGGRTWSPVWESTHPLYQRAMAFQDADTGWMAADSGGLMHTRDGGKTWVRNQLQGVYGIMGLSTHPSGYAWAVGLGGTVLRWIPPHPSGLPELRRPGRRSPIRRLGTDLIFTLEHPERVRILALDAAGRMRLEVFDGPLGAGAQRIPLPPGSDSRPLYFRMTTRP